LNQKWHAKGSDETKRYILHRILGLNMTEGRGGVILSESRDEESKESY
jgi:hypothetical protein